MKPYMQEWRAGRHLGTQWRAAQQIHACQFRIFLRETNPILGSHHNRVLKVMQAKRVHTMWITYSGATPQRPQASLTPCTTSSMPGRGPTCARQENLEEHRLPGCTAPPMQDPECGLVKPNVKAVAGMVQRRFGPDLHGNIIAYKFDKGS